MKYTKRMFSLLLALIMVMSLATTAFADESTYTLTLNGAFEGHTYTAYQIFTGDLNGNALSNIVWGSSVTEAGRTALGDAAEKAATLETAANAEAFAAEVSAYLGTASGSATVAEGATVCEISGLAAGYYLVRTTAAPDKNDVFTYYIMKVVGDTTATVKANLPRITKTVDDNDVNIGDTVTFTLTATMPSTLQGYKTYKIVFHDTLSAGLTYNAITSVVVNGKTLTENDYTVSHENGQLTITIADVLVHGAAVDSEIVVTYTAILNQNAVIGTEGNPNEVYLEYSNNPNWDGDLDGDGIPNNKDEDIDGDGTPNDEDDDDDNDGIPDDEDTDDDNDGTPDDEEDQDEPTGETPEVEVRVYTWEIPVFKYTLDGEQEAPLAGAGFTLYRANNEVVNVVAVEVAEGAVPVYKVCTLTGCTEHTHITEIVTSAGGKFEIEGLEQGTYTLKETTTPAGYNTCADITVTIGEAGVLTQGENTITEVKVLNNAGTELPETGGMGTTLFYILGSVLVLGAVVLLVTKRRMNMAE